MHDVLEGPGGEQGGHEEAPYTMPVTVTLSILAVLVAVTTLFGHRTSKEELLLQSQLSDQWSFYQAKNIRMMERQIGADELATFTAADKEKAATLSEKYRKEAERYEKEKEEASEKAKEIEAERNLAGRRGDRYEGAEVLLEMALIICSFTMLTRNRGFWFAGSALALVGIAIAVSGYLLK